MITIYSLLAFASVTRSIAVDPFDLSFFTKGAAIGDSYAAGIGAGNQVDWSCSRYDGSYANLVALQLGVDPSALDFTYTACSGAVVKGINEQASALSSGQQFIIVSAGGNDADLVGILNSCVYSFWGGLSHPNCGNKIAESQAIIESSSFAASIDGLMTNAKSKLTAGGNIYYVGYAKFFDTSDNSCDSVSWHIWLNLFTREYLTQASRQSMNDLVDLMNDALRAAVARAGPQVHFIDYDYYVGLTNGRFCQPGQDENSGNSANRQDLFFYEMKSNDSPWTVQEDNWSHDELRRRNNSFNDDGDIEPANGTLNALYGSLIQEAIEDDNNLAVLQDDNANMDLEAEVFDEESGIIQREIAASGGDASPLIRRYFVPRGVNISSNATTSWNNTLGGHPLGTYHNHTNLGTTRLGDTMSTGNGSTYHFGNGTTSRNTTSVGTVVANSTHVLLASGLIVEKLNIKKLIISDKTSRVFHPTQGGHALIANLILYQMAADNAQAQGITDFPSVFVTSTGEEWPQIGSAACATDSSDTWANRDAMISAVNSFCADPHNVKGSTGSLTSGVFNTDSLDYMNISVSWDEDASLGEHSCAAWLDSVTDNCDIPSGSQNADNLKHGGTIAYQSKVVNATLNIEPLVVRRSFDGGRATDLHCNDVSSTNYLDQPTLQTNIGDFCTKSAAQPGGIANSGSTFSQTYNDGTPDRVDIKTEWPTGPRNYQIFLEECQYYMDLLTNSCSLPQDNNGMNWKHGGDISDNNGVKYTITPTQTRPSPPGSPQGDCNADYHWWGYSWDVWGGGFESSDFGSNLQSQVKGCGAVTAWTFDYYDTPDSDGTEWHASGTLPLFISSHCLAKAVRSAGGFESNC